MIRDTDDVRDDSAGSGGSGVVGLAERENRFFIQPRWWLSAADMFDDTIGNSFHRRKIGKVG